MRKLKRDTRRRIGEIQDRVEAYQEHKDGPYSFDRSEIEEVRQLESNAYFDIMFLLDVVKATTETPS